MQFFKKNSVLFFIIFLSLFLRVGAALVLGNEVTNLPGTQDQISYHSLALRVLDGYGFSFGEDWWPQTAANTPTAHWSFLYTIYLVLVYTVFGPHPLAARLIQAVLVGMLQPLLVYWIGRRLLGKVVGLVGAAITAVYAYFIYYAATLMSEPLYLSAILAVVLLSLVLIEWISNWNKTRSTSQILIMAACLGLVLGSTVLLRQVFLMFIPFLFLWILWILRKRNMLLTLGSLVLSGVMVAAMVLPFSLYNFSRFNSFVLLNTNAGYAFFFANHTIYGTHFEPILPPETGRYQDLIPAELRQLDEAALDKALLSRGMKFVLDDPVRYVQLSISRLPAFFMFWPSSESGMVSNISRVLSFGIFWPFMLYGIGLVLFSRKYNFGLSSPLFLPLAFCLIYTAIHILSWALIRYRLPVDALLLVFAALALVDLYQRAPSWLKLPTDRLQSARQSGPTSQG